MCEERQQRSAKNAKVKMGAKTSYTNTNAQLQLQTRCQPTQPPPTDLTRLPRPPGPPPYLPPPTLPPQQTVPPNGTPSQPKLSLGRCCRIIFIKNVIKMCVASCMWEGHEGLGGKGIFQTAWGLRKVCWAFHCVNEVERWVGFGGVGAFLLA